jgi:hypothetical protein
MLSSRNDSPDCLHPIVDSVSNRLVRFNSARMAVSMADSSRTGFALEAGFLPAEMQIEDGA